MKIAIWWCFPCQATAAIFKALAEDHDHEVVVLLLDGLSASREKLGWKIPDYGNARVIFLPPEDSGRREVVTQLGLSSFDLHLLNSAYVWPFFNRVIDELIQLNIPYGILTEAPFNGFGGLKRLLKSFYVKYVLPLRVGWRASHAEFVLSLSGEELDARKNLKRMRFPRNAIYCFGYFPPAPEFVRKEIKPPGNPIVLLCTGYLTRNKGQHLLISALNDIQRNTRFRFQCFITGFGPEEAALRSLIEVHNLESSVVLTGPVPHEELMTLYRMADLFVAPAIEEPWGVRINEAIHVGLPIVMSDRIGAVQIMRASGGGREFRSNSAEALTGALLEILQNQSLLEEMQLSIQKYRAAIDPKNAALLIDYVIKRHLERGANENLESLSPGEVWNDPFLR